MSFRLADDDKYQSFTVARWVSDGIDRCIVGRVGCSAMELLDHLEGRLAQVTEFFSESKDAKKKSFSKDNGGVFLAVLVDRYVPGDEIVNGYLELLESDSDNEQN